MLVSTVRGTLVPVSGKIWYDGKNLSSIKADVSIDEWNSLIEAGGAVVEVVRK